MSKIQYIENPSAGLHSGSTLAWRRFRICLLGMGLGTLFLLLLKNPAATAAASVDGILLAGAVVLPSTFPYMILSGVLTGSGVTRAMGKVLRKPVEKLFFISPEGSAVILMGLLSGFPVGAKCAADLYLAGDCTKEEAERLLCFCNFCGPPFILGSIAGFLGNPRAALVIYLTQTTGMLLLGIFLGVAARKKAKKQSIFGGHGAFRELTAVREPASVRKPASVRVGKSPSTRDPAPTKPFSLVFYESVKSACPAMLQIAGFVVFFSILNSLLETISLHRGSAMVTALRGFLEISGGAKAAAATASTIGMSGAIFCSALVTVWSGLSVHMQVASFALPAGLKMRKYYLCHLVMAIAVAAVATGVCAMVGIC